MCIKRILLWRKIMTKFLNVIAGVFVVSLTICGVVAIGASTARLANKVIREFKEPLKPKVIVKVKPRSILLKAKKDTEEVSPEGSQQNDSQDVEGAEKQEESLS
jgi:hypothetical protein